MIGMTLRHRKARVKGVVDAVNIHADGKALCRIKDRWFFLDELVAD